MKILISYYSGAGNTKFIAKKIATSFERQSCFVQCEKITENSIISFEDNFDILGIGFPIYFREAPDLVYDLLKNIKGKNRPVFFFCTKGLYSGNATRNIMKFSIDGNFQPVGFIEFYMPGTDFLILFAKKGSFFEKFLKFIHSRKIDKKIDKFTKELQLSKTTKIPFGKWYMLPDELIVKKLETLYNNQHQAYIEQFYSNPNICIECMMCVESCPRNNITFNKHIQFGSNCDVCFHCIHHCPVEAIQIGDISEGNVRYNNINL
jgi:ferredoxin